MKYWNPPATVCQSLENMLADPNGNGSCIAWAQLLHETLKAQGVAGSQIHELTTNYPDDAPFARDLLGRGIMLVKNWAFAGAGTAPAACAPFTHVEAEVTDQPGVPGQDNPDPPGGFFNHFILKYGGKWHDPSYGTDPFASENDWENASLDGFDKVCNNGGVPLIVRKTNDPAVQEMTFTPLP
jgi:hypothetical protein